MIEAELNASEAAREAISRGLASAQFRLRGQEKTVSEMRRAMMAIENGMRKRIAEATMLQAHVDANEKLIVGMSNIVTIEIQDSSLWNLTSMKMNDVIILLINICSFFRTKEWDWGVQKSPKWYVTTIDVLGIQWILDNVRLDSTRPSYETFN